MLDYTQAQKRYEGRLNKYLGRRIATDTWMKYDSERDCFVCSHVWNKYKVDDKASAEMGHTRYKAVGKDEWDMRPYAEIYTDRIVIVHESANHRLGADFNLRSYKASSNATDGMEWYYEPKSGGTIKAIGSVPVTINLVTEELTPTAPRVRTFDKGKQKELNALIARVRRELKVRYKLGAFNSVEMAVLANSVIEVTGSHVGRYKLLSSPGHIFAMLNMVTTDDIKSFYPLVYVLRWYGGSHNSGRIIDLPNVFERFISSRKESIRLATGVVYYEAADMIHNRH